MPKPNDRVWPEDRDGFRQRGLEMTRIETFTDAAFAFAVSLLVISTQSVPTSYDELISAMLGVPAFALCFLLVMVFWFAHWQWSRRFGLEDMTTIVLSGALVFLVMTYIYPLKFLFSLFVRFYSGGRFSAEFDISGPAELYSIFAIYGFGYAAMAGLIILLNAHALRQREPLGLDALEVFLTRAEIRVWAILGGVGTLSAVLALVTPVSRFVWPGWVYMLLPILMPWFGAKAGRRARLLLAERSAGPPIR
jgi:hypothetical protein